MEYPGYSGDNKTSSVYRNSLYLAHILLFDYQDRIALTIHLMNLLLSLMQTNNKWPLLWKERMAENRLLP